MKLQLSGFNLQKSTKTLPPYSNCLVFRFQSTKSPQKSPKKSSNNSPKKPQNSKKKSPTIPKHPPKIPKNPRGFRPTVPWRQATPEHTKEAKTPTARRSTTVAAWIVLEKWLMNFDGYHFYGIIGQDILMNSDGFLQHMDYWTKHMLCYPIKS